MSQEEANKLFEYRDGKLIRKIRRKGVKDEVQNLTGDGYLQVEIRGVMYRLHRVVWLMHYGYYPEFNIDHIDRCRTNNKIENLREASNSCNMINTKLWRTNTTGIRGIYSQNRKKRWRVTITVNNKKHEIGSFYDLNEAAAHRLATEQCLGWEECQTDSSAAKHIRNFVKDSEMNFPNECSICHRPTHDNHTHSWTLKGIGTYPTAARAKAVAGQMKDKIKNFTILAPDGKPWAKTKKTDSWRLKWIYL